MDKDLFKPKEIKGIPKIDLKYRQDIILHSNFFNKEIDKIIMEKVNFENKRYRDIALYIIESNFYEYINNDKLLRNIFNEISIDDGSKAISGIVYNKIDYRDYELSVHDISKSISKLIEILFMFVLKQNIKISESSDLHTAFEEEE